MSLQQYLCNMSSALGRPFRRLWTASLASNLADGLVGAAAPLLVLRLTDDPLAVSAVTAASFLPWLLLAALSGAVVDRRDRRRVMGAANTVRFLVAAGLGVLVATHHAPVALLVAAVFVLGTMETLFDGGAQALVPAVTPRAALDAANGRFQAGEMVMQGFVAVPVGAALFALAAPMPFALSAATFAASALLAVTLPKAAARAVAAEPDRTTSTAGTTDQDPPGDPTASLRSRLVDGARFLWRHDRLRPLWIVSTLSAAALTFAQGALVVYVVRGLGIPQAAVGAFTALAAVGGVAGAVSAGRLRRRVGRSASMVGSMLLVGPALVVLGLVPASPVGRVAGCVAFAAAAGLVTVWNTHATTVRQRLVPAELLGRVNGTWRTVGWGLTPVMTLAGGAVARVGLRLPLLVGGAVALVVALASAATVRRAVALPDDAAPDGTAEGAAPGEREVVVGTLDA